MLGSLLGLLAVAVCLGANAFFVAAEFALVTVRHTWVEERVRSGSRAARTVKAVTARLDDAIAATQLGITIASIALGWLGEPAIAHLVDRILGPILPFRVAAVHSIAVMLAFTAITLLHVVLGELAPKAVALGDAQRVALFVARPLLLFQRVFRPVIWLMNTIGNAVVRLLGFAPAPAHVRAHSVGELKMLVEETSGVGSLDPTQTEVALRTLDLHGKRVMDVMTPREEVASLDLDIDEASLVELLIRTQYTRMPVWSRRRGRWIGVAHTKALLLRAIRDRTVRLIDAIYQPLTLDRTASLPRALRAFKRRKQHLAFVSDERGRQIGIVTLEDVLEEMVGEIEDELDADEAEDTARMSRASVMKADRPSLA